MKSLIDATGNIFENFFLPLVLAVLAVVIYREIRKSLKQLKDIHEMDVVQVKELIHDHILLNIRIMVVLVPAVIWLILNLF